MIVYCLPLIRSSFNIRSELSGEPANQGRAGGSRNLPSNYALPIIESLASNWLLTRTRR